MEKSRDEDIGVISAHIALTFLFRIAYSKNKTNDDLAYSFRLSCSLAPPHPLLPHLFEPPVFVVQVDHRAGLELIPLLHEVSLESAVSKSERCRKKHKIKLCINGKKGCDRLEKELERGGDCTNLHLIANRGSISWQRKYTARSRPSYPCASDKEKQSMPGEA